MKKSLNRYQEKQLVERNVLWNKMISLQPCGGLLLALLGKREPFGNAAARTVRTGDSGEGTLNRWG